MTDKDIDDLMGDAETSIATVIDGIAAEMRKFPSMLRNVVVQLTTLERHTVIDRLLAGLNDARAKVSGDSSIDRAWLRGWIACANQLAELLTSAKEVQ